MTTKKEIPRAQLPKQPLLNQLYLTWDFTTVRACLHEGGGPQVGEVTCGGLPHLTCKRDQIKMRDYMDRRATPPKRVTSPIWGTPPPCKQALKLPLRARHTNLAVLSRSESDFSWLVTFLVLL